jgi:hypothetical protein
VALDPADTEARTALAVVQFRRGDGQGVLAETEKVLAIAPSLAAVHGYRGAALIYSANPKEGLASLETFFRLDPHSSARLGIGPEDHAHMLEGLRKAGWQE